MPSGGSLSDLWHRLGKGGLSQPDQDATQISTRRRIRENSVSVYDPAQNGNVTYNVTNSRHYVAVWASKDVGECLHDKITFTNSNTNEPIPSLLLTTSSELTG